jgi:PPM family protein phosphatase
LRSGRAHEVDLRCAFTVRVVVSVIHGGDSVHELVLARQAMKATSAWRTGHASDPGLERGVNEDRVFVDEARGLFLVVDGLGGHAAGDKAAEVAVRVIQEQISEIEADPEKSIRSAITEANNQIYELARSNEQWQGMACVLTVVLVKDERVTVGHVGDTRLYLIWNGNLRKVTSDHSPVGEQEDRGQLTEDEAMRHPRRNQVFRDVGSGPRTFDDTGFIEVKQLPFRAEAALLLCSDGLSDVLTSSEISAIVEHYDGDAEAIAQELVAAANKSGGKDNVSVIFIAGPGFLGSQSNTLLDARPRHAATRTRKTFAWRSVLFALLWLVTGMVLGVLAWIGVGRLHLR